MFEGQGRTDNTDTLLHFISLEKHPGGTFIWFILDRIDGISVASFFLPTLQEHEGSQVMQAEASGAKKNNAETLYEIFTLHPKAFGEISYI